MTGREKSLKFFFDLEMFGIKAGLKNIEILLRYSGNPQKNFATVHVAGTNGKGSTSSLIASILTSSGYRTGLYTSPHLVDFRERIRIDGEKIPEKLLISYLNHFKRAIADCRATFFEAATAIAFKYFSDMHVDIAVIETGLGGRWDSTNVVTPLLSVITNIGLDHTEYLGKTISSIAFEKGGIIKPFVPCITGAEGRVAIGELRKIARKNSAPIALSAEISRFSCRYESINGQAVSLQTENNLYDNLFCPFPGDHQRKNIQLAVLAAEKLRKRNGYNGISVAAVKRGVADVKNYSGLRGRFDIIRRKKTIIADVAHNPDGISSLTRNLVHLTSRKNLIVFGVLKDKDFKRMIKLIGPAARLVVAVRPETRRALKSSIIQEEFQKNGVKSADLTTVKDGIEYATGEAREGEAVVLTGSCYLVGEGYKYLGIIP